MRKMTLLKMLVVLVLCVVGVGFYRGWFVLARQADSGESNQVEVQLTLDPDKAREDAEAIGAKARELADGAAEESRPSPSQDAMKFNGK